MSELGQTLETVKEREHLLKRNVAAFRLTSFPPIYLSEPPSCHVSSTKKRALGQFFTQKKNWLQPQIKNFITSSSCTHVYDPFAGSGCLLKAVREEIPSIVDSYGLDLDPSLGWDVNDSLIDIPHKEQAILVTNPPYLSNYSARRKKINDSLEQYFSSTCYDDIYLLALDCALKAQDFVVAIIPESFINSNYLQKDRLVSLTVLEDNPFEDTDTPVLVACFNAKHKPLNQIKMYKRDVYLCTLADVEGTRIQPTHSVPLVFNAPKGWLAVRCVDTTNPAKRIQFSFKDGIDYDWTSKIKTSSRLLTLIDIQVPLAKRSALVEHCNALLETIRVRSFDLILSPFKGNMKNGVRRRRLDYQTCRALVEQGYHHVMRELLTKQELLIKRDV